MSYIAAIFLLTNISGSSGDDVSRSSTRSVFFDLHDLCAILEVGERPHNVLVD